MTQGEPSDALATDAVDDHAWTVLAGIFCDSPASSEAQIERIKRELRRLHCGETSRFSVGPTDSADVDVLDFECIDYSINMLHGDVHCCGIYRLTDSVVAVVRFDEKDDTTEIRACSCYPAERYEALVDCERRRFVQWVVEKTLDCVRDNWSAERFCKEMLGAIAQNPKHKAVIESMRLAHHIASNEEASESVAPSGLVRHRI